MWWPKLGTETPLTVHSRSQAIVCQTPKEVLNFSWTIHRPDASPMLLLLWTPSRWCPLTSSHWPPSIVLHLHLICQVDRKNPVFVIVPCHAVIHLSVNWYSQNDFSVFLTERLSNQLFIPKFPILDQPIHLLFVVCSSLLVEMAI